MNTGYVYILTNEAMPGIVKIGRTEREVDTRATELWRTGVPVPFEVFASVKTCDCVRLEAYMHGELRKHRVHKSREFFEVEPEDAWERLKFWVTFQAREALDEHFDSVSVVQPGHWVDGDAIERLAREAGVCTFDIAQAMGMLTQEEILAPLRRLIAIQKAEAREVYEREGWSHEEIEWALTEGWR